VRIVKKLVLATALLVTVIVALGAVGLATTTAPRPLTSLAELRHERVMFFDEHDLYLVYFDGQVLALDADAQHVGDDVVYCETSELFESPAHGEKFDIRGYYFGGPGRRGLDRYFVEVRGGDIYVDLEYRMAGPEREEHLPRPPQGRLCVPT
jgi:nitrite reductase/ring-hydroxylating ferredoxin subunit